MHITLILREEALSDEEWPGYVSDWQSDGTTSSEWEQLSENRFLTLRRNLVGGAACSL